MGTSGVSRLLSGVGMPDIVQTQMWGFLAHLPQLTKMRGFRGKLLNMSERKKLLKEAIEMPDLVFSHSKTVQEMFSKHTDRKIKILRNGHELSWLKNYHGKTPSDKLRVGYMGQITSIKGIHILVEAFKRANFNGQVQLDIWGNLEMDRDYVDQLKALILDDQAISLCGRFEHDDLANVLSNIDVLAVPSIWYENAPLVIQEAFAAKTPVIATRLGGMAEAVSHNVDGLLFKAGDVADLAEKLRSFIEDPELIKRLVSGIAVVKQVEQEVIELEEDYLHFAGHKSLQRT
jgi:glycosyltransferase involved in cell wall biosynthesis